MILVRLSLVFVVLIIYEQFCIMQGHHFSMLQREIEKLRGDIEKMRSELRFVLAVFCQMHDWFFLMLMLTVEYFYIYRYEIDKVTAGQRLDLNLERG